MGRVRKTKRPRKHHSLGKALAGCGTTPQSRNVRFEHKLRAVDSGLPAQEHTDLVVHDGCGSTPPKSKAVTQLESLEDSVLPSSLELRAMDSGLPAQEITDLVVDDGCGSTPPKSKAATQLEFKEDSVLPSSLELRAAEYANKFLAKHDMQERKNSGDVVLIPSPRYIVDLNDAIQCKKHFKERKNEMKCLLYGLYNILGSDVVITTQQMHAQRLLMDTVQWLPYRQRELFEFVISNKKVNKKGVTKFPNSIEMRNHIKLYSNGDSKGNWTTNLLQECLVRFTNLRLRNLTPRKNYPVKKEVILKLMESYPLLMILLQFTKHETQQAHWLVFKNNNVYDSLLSESYSADNFIYFEFISKVYTVEYNPQIRSVHTK